MLLTGTSMCYCFIASLKNKRHVVIIIILSNQVVTAAIREGCFKNNLKKITLFFPQIFIMAC